MLVRRSLLGVVVVGALARPIAGQSLVSHPRIQEASRALERWLEAEREYRRIPGVSAAVVVDQDVIWQGGTGFADRERKTPATPNTIYSICSISKLFTSISMLQLRDRGKLRLDDPIAKHLPWFALKSVSDEEAGPPTIEGLLTHASGLPAEAENGYWVEPDMLFPTHDRLVAALKDKPLLYRPETYFQYSNLGFTLAGEIVAAAGGKPYADYVRENVLGPLGLTNTFSEMPSEERGKRLAVGYSGWGRSGDRHIMPFYQTKAMAPAAGYASTALDLAKFASWQFRLLDKGGTDVLSANTLREMQRVHFIDPDWETTWGLGFQIWRNAGTTFVGHGGTCPGYKTQLLLQPDEKIATITMANGFEVNAGQLAQQAYQLFAPAIKAARADSVKAPPPPDPSLDRYLGTYETSGADVEVIRWEGGLATMHVPSGEPVKTITKYRKVGEHTFRRIRSNGELGETLTFTIGPDGKATELRDFYRLPRIR